MRVTKRVWARFGTGMLLASAVMTSAGCGIIVGLEKKDLPGDSTTDGDAEFDMDLDTRDDGEPADGVEEIEPEVLPDGRECWPFEITCEGECVNPSIDPRHCGGCDRPCPSERYCIDGECTCPPTLTRCGDDCVNTLQDSRHCGGCDNGCTTGMFCNGQGICNVSCYWGSTACTDATGLTVCASLASDPANCGSCGLACPSYPNAYSTCVSSTCAYACAPGWADADGEAENGCECRRLSFTEYCDGVDNNCDGEVDNAPDFECTAGQEEECSIEWSLCPGEHACGPDCRWGPCANPDWECSPPGDSRTCGGLDACDGGQTCGVDCRWEACDEDAVVCEPGTLDETCTPLGTQCRGRRHCQEECEWGACLDDCLSSAPNCCPLGCRNLAVDHLNCGACGNVCAPNHRCCGGECRSCCSSADCVAPKPQCSEGTCVQCVVDADCTAYGTDLKCCDGTCALCCQDSDCPADVCTGTVLLCTSIITEEECAGQAGCLWTVVPCGSTGYIQCVGILDRSECNNCPGCEWYNQYSTCYGYPACDGLATELECTTCLCTWNYGSCGGTAADCPSLTDEASCEAQAGCTWLVGECIDGTCT